MSLKLGLRNKIRRSRAGGFTGLLDQSFATGATAAYSFRRLKSSATKAVRVRESSGNTETDIGFSGGTLDTTALLNHCGSANGFVTKWYDQSGNGNDASNSTASEQPKIVKSGSVIQENGRPALEFDGDDDFLDNDSVSSPQPNQFFNVFALQTLNTRNDIRGSMKISESTRNLLLSINFSFQVFADVLLDSGIQEDKNQHLITDLYDSPNSIIRFDGSQVKSGSTGTETLEGLRIGANDTLESFGNMTIQEIIFYSTPKTQVSNIETNINNHYSIF